MWTSTLACLLALVQQIPQDELRVFHPGSEPRWTDRFEQDHLRWCLEKRHETLEHELADPALIRGRQERLREAFRSALGGFPERTPLNARVIARETRRGYRLEKILYESQPGFHVTALLFLPLTPARYPGVLVPCGHSRNGKAADAYQRACILLAMNGMAALCYDPIEQGERYQLLDRDDRPILGGTLGHTLIGARAILLGENTATYRIWDGMRGIDYLCQRGDIDGSRIGCTGNSGGGTLTSYLMALDERIDCAAPSCYLTSFARLLDSIGPQDAEQNIHRQLAFGMDHADYVTMRAPRPTLICCTSEDFFDIRGTWESFREARRFYTALGHRERVEIAEAPGKHGFHRPLREAMVRWMKRWLLGRDEAVVEGELDVLTEEEARCTPQGQVLRLPGERSIFELQAAKERSLARARPVPAVPSGLVPLTSFQPNPEVQAAGTIERQGYRIEKLLLGAEGAPQLPALHFVPPGRAKRAVLWVDSAGKAAAAAPGGELEQLALSGVRVLAVDLPGLGELGRTARSSAEILQGMQWKEFFRRYLHGGRSLVALRANVLRICTGFFFWDEERLEVRLVAIGAAATTAALHLEEVLVSFNFECVELRDYLPSWRILLEDPLFPDPLSVVVPGALRSYDLPDLIECIPADKLVLGKALEGR